MGLAPQTGEDAEAIRAFHYYKEHPDEIETQSAVFDEAKKIGKAKQQRAAQAKRREEVEAVKWRTWTDSSGEHTIEAKFAGMTAGKVKLVKRDGSTTQLPLEKLSADDQEWINKRKL